MAERSSRRTRLALLWIAAVAGSGACDHEIDSESRLLEEACAVGECVTSGSARRTTALTSDSIAFKLGTGPGKLIIPIPTFSRSGADTFDLDALVDGAATFRLVRTDCSGDAGACTRQVVSTTSVYSSDYEWHYAGSYSGSSSQFEGFELEVETSASQEIALVDLRYDAYDTAVECGVAAPGRRAR